MKKLVLYSLILISISCQKESEEVTSRIYNLSGVAQKGPFLLGSEVIIIEMNSDLNPTGKVFFSTIENDKGYFAFPDVEFESSFIQVKVEGGYYNEIIGGVNAFSEIILESIVDISENSTVNVNVITHLVQARLRELVKDGLNYSDSYTQAYKELLTIFSIEDNSLENPEKMDLTASDISGGVLLLISAIIQSNIGSGFIFSEFLTKLTNDFKDNGLIDDKILRKTLGTSGLVLDINEVRNNLINRYNDLGQTIQPYFAQQFLNNFNKPGLFETIFDGVFQSSFENYINLINKGDTVSIDKNEEYAIVIKGGASSDISNIQVRITSDSNTFETTGINWFIEGNQKIYLKEYDGADLIVPVEFSGSGELQLELFIVTHSSSMVRYPKIIVNWN